MDTIYIETTIVGHIAGRIHRDPIAASRQQVTRDWWQNNAKNFEFLYHNLSSTSVLMAILQPRRSVLMSLKTSI
ncbi:MAG: hypothetical protein NTW52_08340 [Planctomycetota bacterium]|nr:hypothetical protein [Planctomycetota bacterium]